MISIGQLYADLSKMEGAAVLAGLRVHSSEISERLPEATVALIDDNMKGMSYLLTKTPLPFQDVL